LGKKTPGADETPASYATVSSNVPTVWSAARAAAALALT
jgi:hypothetical protein